LDWFSGNQQVSPILVSQGRRLNVPRLPCLVILLIFLSANCAWGVDPHRLISQYGHTAWRTQDGFFTHPSAITQTTDGYIWIATINGLVRFDGVKFTSWTPPQGQQLPRGSSALLGARDGSLWVGAPGGLAQLKDGELLDYASETGAVSDVIEDHAGTIWFTRYQIRDGKGPLCRIVDRHMQCYGQKDGISLSYGLRLTEDINGNIWFGGSGLCRWAPGSSSVYFEQELKHTTGDGALVVAAGPSGSIWTGLDGTGPKLGVRYYSKGKWVSYEIPGFDGRTIRANEMLMDRNHSLWIGTETKGLYRVRDGVANHYDNTAGLSGNFIESIYEDREGNLWVVTDRGVDVFRDTPVVTFSGNEGLTGANVQSVLALSNGSVWVGDKEALDIINSDRVSAIAAGRGLPGQIVNGMFEDSTGRIWLGIDDAVVTYKSGRFSTIKKSDRSASEHIGVGFAEDVQGNIWTLIDRDPRVTGSGRLLRIKDHRGEEEIRMADLNRPHYLAADRNAGIWVATENGMLAHYLNRNAQTIVTLGSAERPVRVYSLFVDSDNAVLVPSSNGLYRLKDGRLNRLDSGNGLPCSSIFSAIKDNYGDFWLYARCGLLRISASDWKTWLEFPDHKVSAKTFDALDGAQPSVGVDQPSASKSPDGRLWFASGQYIQMIDPGRIYANVIPPPVHIEELVVDHKSYDTLGRVGLPPLRRELEINYTALSFKVPRKVLFRYKLEGQDGDWQEAGTRHQAFYNDLRPGNYRFRVIACNNDGVWNEEGAFLDFSIAPVYYQTNWFLALYVAAFLGVLWSAYRLRVQQLRRQEKKLRDVIETMPIFAWTALADGYVDFVNRHWEEYTGLSTEKTIGSGWEAAVHPEDLERHSDGWRASLASGQPFESEVRFRRAVDGQYRWFVNRAVPLRDGRGKVIKWYGISTDIEGRKRAEQFQADLAHVNRVSTMSELTASLAHDIKQPIGAAVTNAEACARLLDRDQPDVSEAREAALEMARDARHAGQIIDRVRSLYRKDSPHLDIVDVNEIIKEMVLLLRGESHRYAVSLRTDLADELPTITADRVQLQQVFMNLMLNGIESMRENGGELIIKSQLREDGLQVSITDNGVGLPPEKADQIFNAFFTTKPQGTGLGLAITRSIVESHGGRVWAAANPERGTTFHFTLPIGTAVSA
jgi:PAS domain S-box-containing protein